ncbi:MAG: transposase [Proteobacteria bacterium]|nr:transposase [Pseudomonadota bacterium]
MVVWLRQHPGIEIISRDHSGTLADAARRAAPEAVQVADRWHLLENCSRALLEAVKRHRADLQAAVQQVTAEADVPQVAPLIPQSRRHRRAHPHAYGALGGDREGFRPH